MKRDDAISEEPELPKISSGNVGLDDRAPRAALSLP